MHPKDPEDTPSVAIDHNSEVTLHFSLHLTDGSEIDSTFSKAPAVFRMGDGNFLPGFERLLLGLKPGDQESFMVSPERGFGLLNTQNIHLIPRNQFAEDMVLTEGLVIGFSSGPANFDLPGVIKEVEDHAVLVDFNHPLAGRELVFSVNIIDVRPQLQTQLQSGQNNTPQRIDVVNLAGDSKKSD